MHDTLRSRILRRLETLPETQLYQVLDYIEFLESRYATRTPQDPGGLQRWAERLEDSLRKRTVNPGNLREAFQLISVADRVLNSVSEAGRHLLDELQAPGETGPEGWPSRRPDPGTPPAPGTASPPPRGAGAGDQPRQERDRPDPEGGTPGSAGSGHSRQG